MHKNIHIPEKLPFLEAICWQTRDVYQFTPEEMLNRYERGWEYRQIFDNLSEEEINHYRERCFANLYIETDKIPEIIHGIDLAANMGLETTEN
jgi:hypothetical protein